MGVYCEGTYTGGPWSTKEKRFHINCLELLSATLAVETFLKNQENKYVLAVITGQHNSSGICKQSGRNSLRPGNENSQQAMDVVLRTSDSPDSSTLAWERQYQDRHGVETDEGSLRLDVEPVDISINYGNISVPGGPSVCNAPDLPTPSLLQLETRSPGRSDRRLSPRLESSTGLCQPVMELGGKGFSESAGSDSRPDSGRANMAITTLVWDY